MNNDAKRLQTLAKGLGIISRPSPEMELLKDGRNLRAAQRANSATAKIKPQPPPESIFMAGSRLSSTEAPAVAKTKPQTPQEVLAPKTTMALHDRVGKPVAKTGGITYDPPQPPDPYENLGNVDQISAELQAAIPKWWDTPCVSETQEFPAKAAPKGQPQASSQRYEMKSPPLSGPPGLTTFPDSVVAPTPKKAPPQPPEEEDGNTAGTSSNVPSSSNAHLHPWTQQKTTNPDNSQESYLHEENVEDEPTLPSQSSSSCYRGDRGLPEMVFAPTSGQAATRREIRERTL